MEQGHDIECPNLSIIYSWRRPWHWSTLSWHSSRIPCHATIGQMKYRILPLMGKPIEKRQNFRQASWAMYDRWEWIKSGCFGIIGGCSSVLPGTIHASVVTLEGRREFFPHLWWTGIVVDLKSCVWPSTYMEESPRCDLSHSTSIQNRSRNRRYLRKKCVADLPWTLNTISESGFERI